MTKNPDISTFTLCADDFALSPAISETIADLAFKGCINAISCMTSMEAWTQSARLIAELGHDDADARMERVEIGLHLVLASEQPLTRMTLQEPDGRLPSVDRMMMLAYAGRLDLGEIATEIDAQFAAFIAARGRVPDFVDAHQHVHAFPGIRNQVIAATRRHAPGAWIRNPAERLPAMLDRPFIGKAIGSTLHAAGLAKAFRRRDIPSNDSFAGHYDFRSDYAALLPHFFRRPGRRHLIMCHPGSGHLKDDTIADARIREADVLGRMPLKDRLGELRRAS